MVILTTLSPFADNGSHIKRIGVRLNVNRYHVSNPNAYTPPGGPTPLSTDEIQRLIAEGKLLRILRPDLRENIQRLIRVDASDNPRVVGHVVGHVVDHVVDHVVVHRGEIYLSFQGIDDSGERELVYHLVQQLQAGAVIDMALLPEPLRVILEPGHVRRSRLAAAFMLCGLTGVASGVVALAISVLATTVLSMPVAHFAGMEVTAIVFVVFCVLGWFASAVIVWARFKPPSAKVYDQRSSM